MDGNDRQQFEDCRNFAEEIVREAGDLTLKYFRSGVAVEYKEDRSPVTEADKETERLLRARISERYPEHGLAGEELGVPESRGEWTWVIDPIDGTQAFVHGVPLYTVLVALLHGGEPVVGVIHNPGTKETVSAAVGGGCRLNGRPTRVRSCKRLEEAETCTTDFAVFARDATELHERVVREVPLARTWADAYGYLLLATGRIDMMIDPHMAVWDIAPMYPIIEEAGGRITTIDGRRDPLGTSAVAACPELHRRLLPA
ncbi:MAG: inositol monophosphatase family protein [Spirochaetaceae bacterium]